MYHHVSSQVKSRVFNFRVQVQSQAIHFLSSKVASHQNGKLEPLVQTPTQEKDSPVKDKTKGKLYLYYLKKGQEIKWTHYSLLALLHCGFTMCLSNKSSQQ